MCTDIIKPSQVVHIPAPFIAWLLIMVLSVAVERLAKQLADTQPAFYCCQWLA